MTYFSCCFLLLQGKMPFFGKFNYNFTVKFVNYYVFKAIAIFGN